MNNKTWAMTKQAQLEFREANDGAMSNVQLSATSSAIHPFSHSHLCPDVLQCMSVKMCQYHVTTKIALAIFQKKKISSLDF
jgi:hypothetical protein